MATMTNPACALLERQEPIARCMVDNLDGPRNALPLIRHVPFELLEAIFIQCAHDHYVSNVPPYDEGQTPSWVNVSYVCRHWRSVALTCPTLWTYHFVVSLRWTEELLARSKQVSLKIRISFINPDTFYSRFRQLERLMEHLDRIQELHLHHLNAYPDRVLSKLSSPAPCLQTLEIHRDYGFHRWPSVLFDGNPPVLRRLELSRCSIPWNSLYLGGLTTLCLRRVPPMRLEADIVGFLAALNHMQDLRHLYIEDSLIDATDFLSGLAFETFQKINLPHLAHILVDGQLSMVITMLSCVNIPLEAELRLLCKSDYSFSLNNHHPVLSSLLAQRFRMLENQAHFFPTVRSLIIHYISSEEVTLTFSTSERDSNPFDSFVSPMPGVWGYDVPLKVAMDCTDSDDVCWDSVVINICHFIPLTDVESLHVLGPSSQYFWMKMLRRLPTLQYLKLSGGCLPRLDSILSFPAQESMMNWWRAVTAGRDGEWDKDGVVPCLEELLLSEVRLNDDARISSCSMSQGQLLEALSTRRNAARGRLIMTRCVTEGPTQSTKLDDVVRSWDGVNIWAVGEGNSHWECCE